MDLLQLNYFRVVASLEHMTKAAEFLHVSQPSLSRTISNLEKELGVELFNRASRKIQLNQYGRAFLRHVNNALDELQSGRQEIETLRQSAKPIIVSCALTGAVTDLIDAFQQSDPQTSIIFRIDPFNNVFSLLKSKEVDFVISDTVLADFNVDDWVPVTEERLYALMSRQSKFAGKSAIYLHDLQYEPLALPESSAPIRGVLNHFFTLTRQPVSPAYEINDVYTQLHIVERGAAISLLPSSALFDIITKQEDIGYGAINKVVAAPIADPGIAWKVAVSPPSGRNPSSQTKLFYQVCMDYFSRRQKYMNEILANFCRRS